MFIRLLSILTPLCLLTGCQSTANQSQHQNKQNSDYSNQGTNQPQHSAVLQKQDFTDMADVSIPTGANILEVRKHDDGDWRVVDTIVTDKSLRLKHGKYRVEVDLAQAQNSFTEEIEINDVTAEHHLRTTVSPDQKLIFLWSSNVPMGSEEFQKEKLKVFCTSPRKKFAYGTNYEYSDFALKACEKLASEGDAEALAQLGYFYQKGIGTDINTDKSINYYQQAYEKGDVRAGVQLAYLYSDKYSFKEEQLALWQSLAAKNVPSALANMAMEYMVGERVEQNKDKAEVLAMKSAKLGNTFSYRILSELEMRSEDFNPNTVDALAWGFVNQIMAPNCYNSHSNKRYLDSIKSQMSETQIHQSKARVVELLALFEDQYEGEICVTNLGLHPDYQDRKISVSINEYEEQFDVSNGSVKFENLLTERLHYRVNILVDDVIATYKQISFSEAHSNSMCVYYDEDQRSFAEGPSFEVNCTCV